MAGDVTILAVDDSASVRKLVELTLRREGYAVVSAGSGLAALAAVERHRPSLILMDVMLVALDGFQLCRAIRANEELSDLPIVILTGRESAADRAAGEQAGVSAYLTKPFRPEALIAVVREQLGQSARSHDRAATEIGTLS